MPSPFPNPPTDFSNLVQPTNGSIVLGVFIQQLVGMGIRADLWPKRGVMISAMTIVANFFASAINFTIIPAIKMGLLPTSVGAWLAWLALYFYGVQKVTATFATGQVTLTNNGGGLFNIPAFAAIFQSSVTKKTYTNTTAIALSPGPGTTQTVSVQATQIGTASNANPGDISIIVTTMNNVTMTNLASVLGLDDQPDASLRDVCWNAIAANSAYGPRTSFQYAISTAINPVTLAPVNINRSQILPSNHTGGLLVYVAAPSGVPDPNDVQGVRNNMEGIARPQNVQVTVSAAGVVPDTDTLTCYVTNTPGLNPADVQTAIATRLSNFFASPVSNPIGGKSNGLFNGLFADAVEAAAISAWPPRPTDPTIPWQSSVFDVTGGNDLALTAGQVAGDSVTVVVVLV